MTGPKRGAPIPFTGTAKTVYDQIGGEPAFRRLVGAFYQRVAGDPILRPLYPDELEAAEERLTLFLIQFFGGPRTYSEERGAPALRMRHQPFAIGRAEREAWLKAMLDALAVAEIEEPARSVMRQYFEATSEFLINREE